MNTPTWPELDFNQCKDTLFTLQLFTQIVGKIRLLYDQVRSAADPEETLMRFLNSTYKAAAETGKWKRNELECDLTYFEQ